MTLSKIAACTLAAILADLLIVADSDADRILALEDDLAPSYGSDPSAPVDFGFGPGVKPPASGPRTAATAFGSAPVGAPNANVTGMFGAPMPWPIIAIHVILLPDGRVLNYGTDETGAQGAELLYDVWDPTLEPSSSAHLVLPNTTATDIFCSGQSVMWLNGDVLITGGDLTINGKRNYARNDSTVFAPQANTLSANPPMAFPRWYASLVSLPNGEMAVFGGHDTSLTAKLPVITPEVFNPATGWRTLTGAKSKPAFGQWYYPRSYVAPGGNVFVLQTNGTMYSVSTAGSGSISAYPQPTLPGSNTLPTVTFSPGKLLSVRLNAAAIIVDVTGPAPAITPTAPMSQVRYWASGTVLPDG
jgi:hypothetical protein